MRGRKWLLCVCAGGVTGYGGQIEVVDAIVISFFVEIDGEIFLCAGNDRKGSIVGTLERVAV